MIGAGISSDDDEEEGEEEEEDNHIFYGDEDDDDDDGDNAQYRSKMVLFPFKIVFHSFNVVSLKKVSSF